MSETVHVTTIVGARPQFIKASAYGNGRAAERICEIIISGQTQVPHGGKR